MDARVVLVGIDEAGYGPILGPLLVSAVAFELPAASADQSMWELLRGSVTPRGACRQGRVPILDSKKLYHRSDGLGRLERSVLAIVGAWRGVPPSMRCLLGLLCPAVVRTLDAYPWYQGADPALPAAADAGGIRIASRLLRTDMQERQVRVAGCWCEVLPEGHYNRLVGSTRSKAVVLSGLTLRLLQRAAEACPGRELRVLIDKQGGREHYGAALLRAFEDRRLKVLEESDTRSAYELTSDRGPWRVSYHQAGESHHLPIAAASMVSKYVRELLMECFNRYWAAHVPGLKPTAGYYEDGLRFLRDLQPHLAALGVKREQLVRQR